ncbi:MAG: phosphate/phosphite/phosphonate ABC transporter substrate-binding protein [bacterium]
MSRRLITIAILSLFIVFTGSCTEESEIYRTEFNFPDKEKTKPKILLGNIPSETVIHRLREYTPLIKAIEEKLEVNVQQSFSNSYDGIVRNMLEEKYDIALLAPLAYARYRNQVDTPAYSPIVQPVRYGSDFYRGIIFTHKNSGIKALEDMKGKTIAFVDEDSASGYLFPRARLLQEKIVPEDYFAEINFLGRHDLVVRAVFRGEFDVGVAYDGARSGNIPEEANPDEALPILTKTEKIPTSPAVINEKFRKENPEISKKLIELLTSLHTTNEGRQALESLGIDKYIETTDSDYDVVREAVNILQQK